MITNYTCTCTERYSGINCESSTTVVASKLSSVNGTVVAIILSSLSVSSTVVVVTSSSVGGTDLTTLIIDQMNSLPTTTINAQRKHFSQL